MICAYFVFFLNDHYIFYFSFITLLSNVLRCQNKNLHTNDFDLKGAKNIAFCKCEHSSAETKKIK